MNTKNMNPIVYFVIVLFLGELGIHKFIDGQSGKGILYLCTCGLFGIGWIIDVVKALLAIINTPAPSTINMAIPTATVTKTYEQVEQKPVGSLSKISLGNYISPSGGYCNYAIFDVVAINPKTNRKNTVRINAKDEADAINKVKLEKGFVEPFEVNVIEFSKPTEKQIEYALNIGIVLPDKINIEDISAMLTRFEYQSNGATQELADYADAIGVNFSAYIGYEMLISCIAGKSDRERCALYAYAVNQSLKNEPIANMLNDEKCNIFYEFADYAITNDKILKSIKDRQINDYFNPYKGTMAYKEALNYMSNK